MQLRKISPLKMMLPTRAATGMWYRLSGWREEAASALPEQIIPTLAPRDHEFKHLSFTFAVIALCARVACADGKLTREKYLAFRDSFPLSGGLCGKIRRLFALACENQTPFESYVTQIKHMFPRQQELFHSLVDRLFRIATAGGDISREEERMLARIAYMLELSASEYSELRDRHLAPRPHQVLGVSKRVRGTTLKKRYYDLMKRWHPDRYASEAISPEVSMILSLKVAEINAAYRVMSKKAA